MLQVSMQAARMMSSRDGTQLAIIMTATNDAGGQPLLTC